MSNEPALVRLPSGFDEALGEADDFLTLFDNEADDNALISLCRKISPLALEIVTVRLKRRDLLQAKRTEEQR